MNFRNSNSLFRGIIILIFMAFMGCNEKGQYTDEKYEAILYRFHSQKTSPNEIKDIDLVLSKKIDSSYTGLIYKLNQDHYYGFLEGNSNLISYAKLNGNGSKSMFHKNHCFILLNEKKTDNFPEEEDYCFTVFVGQVPFKEYSEIEMEWNCGEKSVQPLENNEYFFFFRNSTNNEICNVKLRKSDGQIKDLAFSQYTNSFETEN
ncbi:hypothetical protein C8P64_1228 [Christiangramia gaetbulicola]|uniref:Lipoprotein n=1 Tax=Christiangramia gaetbulicola TaxID=703340 RepID=A0A2T6ANA1_9FLAO|nr:hypothetical protein [Christiangramia gaetbulicola]PTX45236.1 hypothetical protein C8P64_1228 [Christiangramia gaetbulicola]